MIIQNWGARTTTIHVIDLGARTHGGTWIHACLLEIGAVRRITDERLPPPIAEDQGVVVLEKEPTKQA